MDQKAASVCAKGIDENKNDASRKAVLYFLWIPCLICIFRLILWFSDVFTPEVKRTSLLRM